MAREVAAYPRPLNVTCLVAPVYSASRLNEMFLIKIFLNLGTSPPFPQQNFCCATLFCSINDCYIFELERQNKIIIEPQFLQNLSFKKKSEETMFIHLTKNCNFLRI